MGKLLRFIKSKIGKDLEAFAVLGWIFSWFTLAFGGATVAFAIDVNFGAVMIFFGILSFISPFVYDFLHGITAKVKRWKEEYAQFENEDGWD